MSAFEINVTPSRLRKKKRLEGREPTVVVMAPFSAKAIVQFEDVPISKTAKRILRVLNTSDEDIEWLQHTIPRCDEVSMELVWNPQNETACKETLQLLDNRNFRKDVVVILKSKHNQPEKLARKFPTIGKKLQLKSPTGNRKSQKSVTSTMSKKESIITHARATVYKSALHIGTSTVSQSPLIERNIFKSALVNPAIQTQHEQPVAQSHLLPLSICSKENVSPVQPSNVLSIIEKMKFTPLADKKPVATSTAFIDNLKAWPTPTLERNIARQVDSNDICPRSLNPALAEEIMDVSCLLASQMATNKTFDIKISDSINLSVDTLHSKKDEIVMHTANETLNQTTTILNAPESQVLSCISEEEDIQAANNYMVIKAHPETRAHDMKKDIQLVGSPLRKYSESMKNLNLLSPQNKIAIQGSMPNLNEMLPLRSIEQNRYYENHQISNDLMHRKMPFLNSSSSSEVSILLHHDVQFNQYEILAQSSRFNLHEVGSKTKPINHALQSIKRRSCELSLSDATSNETLHRSETIIISPPKKQRFDVVCFLQQRLRLLIQMWHQRRQFKSFRQSAIDLQRRYRAHRIMNVTRTKYQRLRSTVIWMQLKFRAKKNMQQLRAEFLKIRNITSHVRGFLARKYVHTLMTPVMKEHLNQKRAALVIQRYWRGYRSRCHLRNAGLQLIRQRLTKLRQRSEGMKTVRAKVQELVRVLRGRFVASEALAALNHLDRLSRTVPHLMTCCSEFLSSFCYGIMAQAIRSEVDKQLIERCSRIILNLTRYNCNTFQESGLVTIAQMLLRWCDKDSDIFNTLCTLIWIFSHCPNKRKFRHRISKFFVYQVILKNRRNSEPLLFEFSFDLYILIDAICFKD
ncbi:asp [Drosophila busckii]|uniref:Asp n=1 Tax=Drosophila busckii TaxID=30019 RepID=A0A0M4EH95_DROBS|nr:asp [Drosophila busckii]